jgi:hypothetical protein
MLQGRKTYAGITNSTAYTIDLQASSGWTSIYKSHFACMSSQDNLQQLCATARLTSAIVCQSHYILRWLQEKLAVWIKVAKKFGHHALSIPPMRDCSRGVELNTS